MPMRPLVLPNDLSNAADMLVRSFQYPDHPEWGVQSDEQEQIVESMRRMRRIWPLVRALQLVSPALRDIARGFVWEEVGAIAAMTIANREGLTQNWYIGTVAVLPEFRRRGLARKLVLATLDMMRAKGGTRVTLGVIDGNVPAQNLYRSLGFVEYGGSTRYSLTPQGAVECPKLSGSYTEQKLAEFDWRTRYELDKRIVPEELQRFEPIEPGAYRAPWLVQALAPILRLAQGARSTDVLVRRVADGVVVARAGWTISTTGKGVNLMRVRVDPAHGDLAPYLVRRCLTAILGRSPGLRVVAFVPNWMPAVAQELETLGFTAITSGKTMGMDLSGVALSGG